jgi:hypothetical protein
VSPLLVQTLGWYQVLANLVTLAATGVAAERVLGRWRWVLGFLAGTAGSCSRPGTCTAPRSRRAWCPRAG